MQLALRLLDTLPPTLTRAFRVIILADTAFGSVRFLKGVRQRRHAAIVGVRGDRSLVDGRQLRHLWKPGQQVRLKDLPFPVTMWYGIVRNSLLERDNRL